MRKLRFLAIVLAAALFALALSVGAALAESERAPAVATTATAAKQPPHKFNCPLRSP